MADMRYAARIRWHAAADPAWEIETHHGGFESAEDAALFVNGLAEAAVAGLELERGEFRLELTTGGVEALLPSSVTVWTLETSPTEDAVATDADFHPVLLGPSDLTARGLDGGFVPLGYAVLGPGGAPIDVAIALDDDLGTLNVTVNSPDAPEGDGPPRAGLLFGIIPRA